MLGVRLAESRKRAGWSQHQLAIELGGRYDQSVISAVENKRSSLRLTGAVKAAQVLDVSLDYLLGLTDDPAPVDDRVREAEERTAREPEQRVREEEERKRKELKALLLRAKNDLKRRDKEIYRLRARAVATPERPDPDLAGLIDDPTPVDDRVVELEAELQRTEAECDRLRAQAKGPRTIEGFRPIADLDVEAAAGPEAYVEKEPVIGHLAFREDWLAGKGINPDKCSIIQVRGRSMEPTLQAGSRILVDRQRTRRLRDRIFVVWTEDGVVVKRLARDGDDWILVSDNADYPPIPWPEGAEVVGQVMWNGKNL